MYKRYFYSMTESSSTTDKLGALIQTITHLQPTLRVVLQALDIKPENDFMMDDSGTNSLVIAVLFVHVKM